MGLPALFFPQTSSVTSLAAVDRAVLDAVGVDLRSLLDDARRSRPPEHSAEETALVHRYRAWTISLLEALGPSFLQVLRTGVDSTLIDLVRKELSTAEVERKLALRHLEQSVRAYGVFVETVGASFKDLSRAALELVLEELKTEPPISEEERIVVRLQINMAVALDVLDGPLDELTFWSFRTLTDARRVAALPMPVITGLRGELARVRAKRSWADWDSKEIDAELAPWPTSSP